MKMKEMKMNEKFRDQWFWWKEKKQMLVWREVLWVFSFLFLVWGTYRLFFRLPLWVEEVVLKAIVFGGPVWWVARKKGIGLKELGITSENFFTSVYLGLGLGVILGFVGQLGNLIRHGTVFFEDFGLTSEMMGGFIILSLVTACWEELVFSGYMVARLKQVVKTEQMLVAMVGCLFALLHVPALIVQGMSILQVGLSLWLLLVLGMGNAILRLRQKNLVAPIMAHALWGVAVFLFR